MVQAKHGEAAPKPRFGFKRKDVAHNPTAVAPPATVAPLVASQSEHTFESPALELSNLKDQYLDNASFGAQSQGTHGSDITLSGLDGCVVNLLRENDHFKITSVHGTNLRNTVLILPHISGSILLNNCSRCTVAVSCHQVRPGHTCAIF